MPGRSTSRRFYNPPVTTFLLSVALASGLVQSPALVPQAGLSPARLTVGDVFQVLTPAGILAGAEAGLFPHPDDCRWCDRDASGRDTLNRFDRDVRSALVANPSARKANARASDVLLYGVMLPTAMFYPTLAADTHEARVDALRMMLWAQALTSTITQSTKWITRRERPAAHFGEPDDRPGSRYASFFSGHSSAAFAAVTSMVQTCRLTGCRGERWMWIAGVPTASVVGILRVRSDKHYATDVLAGAAVGMTVGWFTPKLIRAVDPPAGAASPAIEPLLTRSMRGVQVAFVW